MAKRLTARELIERVVDPGSYVSWDREPIVPGAGIDEEYAADLAAAR